MRIGLFVPCYIDAIFPEVAIATLELLESLGHEVSYPAEQTCCGQPMANTGDQKAAAATEAHFVRCFESYQVVVGPSGSCVHHVRAHLDACEQTQETVRVREAVRELSEFLHGDLKVETFPKASLPHKVGVHDSCTAVRGLKQARPPELPNRPPYSISRDLLKKMPGLEIVEAEHADECCGFGGSFCVTDAAVSAKMGHDRANDFARRGAEYIASGDMSCLLQIKGVIDREKLPIKVVHVAQILNGWPFA